MLTTVLSYSRGFLVTFTGSDGSITRSDYYNFARYGFTITQQEKNAL